MFRTMRAADARASGLAGTKREAAMIAAGENTTIAVVATDAALTKAEISTACHHGG